jgi:hypothetical protein
MVIFARALDNLKWMLIIQLKAHLKIIVVIKREEDSSSNWNESVDHQVDDASANVTWQ